MRLAAAIGAVAFSGFAVSLPASIFWIVLDIPARLMRLFGLRRTCACAWALTLGAILGAMATLAKFSLCAGQAAGGLMLLLCGLITGMIAAALSEMLELLPRLIFQLHLRPATHALCIAFALGKMLGAFMASLSST